MVASKQFNLYAKGSSDSSSSLCLLLNPTTESVKDVIEHGILICSQPEGPLIIFAFVFFIFCFLPVTFWFLILIFFFLSIFVFVFDFLFFMRSACHTVVMLVTEGS